MPGIGAGDHHGLGACRARASHECGRQERGENGSEQGRRRVGILVMGMSFRIRVTNRVDSRALEKALFLHPAVMAVVSNYERPREE